jgi:hypothetical protein
MSRSQSKSLPETVLDLSKPRRGCAQADNLRLPVGKPATAGSVIDEQPKTAPRSTVSQFDDDLNERATRRVQVQPGMLVAFDCGLPGPHCAGTPPEPPTNLKDIVAGLEWAPVPRERGDLAARIRLGEMALRRQSTL